ncbi:hypothetical protein L7F22_034984 [Adiantum nelumboides]|nr:hypothetical protein [Adiantum nelumboides]
MDASKRRSKGLPTEDFPQDLYNRMVVLFAGDCVVDVGGLLVDSVDSTPLGDEKNPIVGAHGGGGGDRMEQGTPPAVEADTTLDLVDDASFGGIRQKRRARAHTSTMRELVETTCHLSTIFEGSKSARAARFTELSVVQIGGRLSELPNRKRQGRFECNACVLPMKPYAIL